MKEGRGGALALPAAIVICNLCAGVRLAKRVQVCERRKKIVQHTRLKCN